ncbi:hypothetical protein CO641_12085 [Lysobacteraceae bacterium NML91-0213]|nr:hypothetical protein CO641_12085 [Xanthomonadaceae bacterium NML91-0213]
MTGADVLLAVLALGVAIFLSRGSRLLVAALLIASALAVSAMLFLPTPLLTGLLGADCVQRLYGLTRSTPLDPPEWIHLLAFAWLGLLVWLARKDVRNWRGVVLVIALGVAAELSQRLTDGRQPKLEDAALNVLGGLTGMLLASRCCALAARCHRGGTRAE